MTCQISSDARHGRKADVCYEDQIILELREVVGAIRALNIDYVSCGTDPPKEDFRTVIREAVEAMHRISK